MFCPLIMDGDDSYCLNCSRCKRCNTLGMYEDSLLDDFGLIDKEVY